MSIFKIKSSRSPRIDFNPSHMTSLSEERVRHVSRRILVRLMLRHFNVLLVGHIVLVASNGTREYTTRSSRGLSALNIKFYGGINEIGGNRILVEDGSTRIFLDYGMSFSRNQKFFEEFLKPRYSSVGLKDLLRLNLIHDLPGVYRTDLLQLMDKDVNKSPSINGIVLSHIHMDHSAFISLLDERIPIVCSSITNTYAKAILDVGNRALETEIYNFKRRPILNNRDEAIRRTFICPSSGKEIEVGDVKVTPFAVDHSVLGANGYVLKTRDSTIVYTGDLRLHGKATELTEKFIEAASNADPDVLLCEGTRIDELQSTSEQNVLDRSIETVRKSKGLVIADFAYRDLTRLKTFYDVAAKRIGNL